jgi:antitoxin CcdA
LVAIDLHILRVYDRPLEDAMTTAIKQRTNVSLDAALLSKARAHDLNVSAISEAALAEAVRIAEAAAWVQQNAEILAERREWIAQNGTPLASLQVLKTD